MSWRLAAALLLGTAREAAAQAWHPLLAGGAALGLGRFGQQFDAGVSGSAGARRWNATGVLGWQLDATLRTYAPRYFVTAGNARVAGLHASLLVAPVAPWRGRLQPYVLVSAGVAYRAPIDGLGLEFLRPTGALGAGVEVSLGQVTPFAESRLEYVSLRGRDQLTMPLTVGLRLGGTRRATPAAPSDALARRTTRDSARAASLLDRVTGDLRLGGWGGYSSGSAFGILPLGRERYALTAIRAAWTLVGGRRAALEWTIDAVPLAVVSIGAIDPRLVCPAVGCTPSGTVTGFGVMPVGLSYTFAPARAVAISVSGAGGVMSFRRAVPTLEARGFNFAIDAGLGAEVRVSARTRLTGGWRFHHVSNANSALANPGWNAGLWWAGLVVRR